MTVDALRRRAKGLMMASSLAAILAVVMLTVDLPGELLLFGLAGVLFLAGIATDRAASRAEIDLIKKQ